MADSDVILNGQGVKSRFVIKDVVKCDAEGDIVEISQNKDFYYDIFLDALVNTCCRI